LLFSNSWRRRSANKKGILIFVSARSLRKAKTANVGFSFDWEKTGISKAKKSPVAKSTAEILEKKEFVFIGKMFFVFVGTKVEDEKNLFVRIAAGQI
jgi:hypothetical protein